MYITQRQLDEAEAQSCGVATRLLRNLLMVFFTPNVMGASSCLGTRNFVALNQDIIGACFSKSKMGGRVLGVATSSSDRLQRTP